MLRAGRTNRGKKGTCAMDRRSDYNRGKGMPMARRVEQTRIRQTVFAEKFNCVKRGKS